MDRHTLLPLARLRAGLAREDGQTLTEYALLVALIALALIGAIGILAGGLNGIFHAIGDAVTAVAP